MRHHPFGTALLVVLACAGADTRAEPVGPVPRPVARIFSGPTITERMQIIDADLARGLVAVRVEYREEEPGELTCRYAGMASENLGVRLYLVHVASKASLESWEVYRSPAAGDTTCTTDEEAVAALTAAKAAMGAAGLDPAKRLEPVPATGGEGEPRDLRRPNESRRSLDLGEGHVLDVVLTHESDQGYHTYTATVSSQGRALLAYELSPNPSMAGSGDIEVVGAISDGDRAIVVFEESWGPGGRWDNWVFGPVLVLD